jgi:hypothetical protein
MTRTKDLNRLGLVLALVGWAALSGCTGTVEEVPKTLLVVGFAEGGVGRLALVENNVLEVGLQPLRWLDDSVRDLPGLPLAADVIERTNAREALLVLSRDDTGVSYLSTFDLRNLAPDQVAGFTETERIALNDPNDPLPADPGQAPPALCPTRVQVSRDGNLAALLNEPRVCDPVSTERISIAVLRLDPAPPRFVRSYDGPVFPLVGGALLLDQVGNALYFLEEVAGGVQLMRLDLASPSGAVEQVGGTAALDATEVQDLGIVQDALVVLASGRFAVYDNFRTAPGDPTVERTTPGSRRLITSDFADIPQVIVLGNDRLTVHVSVTAPAEPPATLPTYRAGTVEALNELVFVVRSGQVAVFDLATYTGGTPRLQVIPLADLVAPAFVGWVAALPLP